MDSQESVCSQTEQPSRPFEGQLISITRQKLVMTNIWGKESCLSLAKDARFTCEGTSCAAEDLEVGSNILVTTEPDEWNVVSCVEVFDRQSEFTRSGN